MIAHSASINRRNYRSDEVAFLYSGLQGVSDTSPTPSGDRIGRRSDAELLGDLIGVQECRQQYRGSLQPFFADGETQSHTKCAVARELVKRWLAEEMMQRQFFDRPDAVRDFLKLHFAGQEYESFVVLYLDAQNCLIDVAELFRRTLNQTAVYPREVVKSALFKNAAGFLFSHNHPSGSPKPSLADEQLTQKLKAALAMVDIRVLDHLVIAGSNCLSFAERGMI